MINDSLMDFYRDLDVAIPYPDMGIHQSKERTLGYQYISNSLGVPFLAHPSRSYYKFLDISECNRIFTRRDIINKIDKELMEYYVKVVNKEIGREYLKFEYPVLIDMIKKGASTPEEELRRALEIREEKYVVAFREHVFQVEQVINQGNTQALLGVLKSVSDLAKDITTKYARNIYVGEISISITPSFSIPISIKTKRKHGLHTTFIRKLLEFGVYERNGIKY